jgi:hypothetical protein
VRAVACAGTFSDKLGSTYSNLRERDHLKDLDVDGKIMLKWTFKKWDGEA